jgi:hypothetical protein
MSFENVTYLPIPETLTAEQREHWQSQAAYWGVREEDAMAAVEYAQRQREHALRMLGILSVEHGLEG